MTTQIPISGLKAQVAVADGMVEGPSISFSNDVNTGFYRPGSDTIGVVTGGVERMRVGSDGVINASTAMNIIRTGAVVSNPPLLYIANSNANMLTSVIRLHDFDGTTPGVGSSMSIDMSAGYGLINIVAGADLRDAGGYKYCSTRGASRILLGDGNIALYVGNGSSGGQSNGDAVTWNSNYVNFTNTGLSVIGAGWAGTGSSAGFLAGTPLQAWCERTGTIAGVGDRLSWGNGSVANIGMRMPFAGKIYYATLNVSILTNGSVTHAIRKTTSDGTSTLSTATHSITVNTTTGSSADWFSNPFSFSAGDRLCWECTSLSGDGQHYVLAFWFRYD